MMTGATRETAEKYLQGLAGMRRTGTLGSLSFLANAYSETDRRSQRSWFHTVETTGHAGDILVVFCAEEEELEKLRSALFVVDMGEPGTVSAWYVQAWNVTGLFVILGRVLPQDTRAPRWLLTPRRAYHAVFHRYDS